MRNTLTIQQYLRCHPLYNFFSLLNLSVLEEHHKDVGRITWINFMYTYMNTHIHLKNNALFGDIKLLLRPVLLTMCSRNHENTA
jgi:hypothetical protein